MLADTDVGSIITAGQSGVQWGYRLLLVQFALMPILYVVQELTVRLGIFSGKGHGELIRSSFGPVWAWVSAAGLAIATAGALLTEFSGVAGVGELFGLPRAITLPLAALTLLAIVLTGSYRRVERAAMLIGAFELAFFGIAWAAAPDWHAIDIPIRNPDYLFLVAADIGRSSCRG
jgi:Mn2+/Fe2+ NRAMP family transporter